MEQCARCGADGAKFKCSRCQGAFYCQQSCQREHWATHKVTCKSEVAKLESNMLLVEASALGDLARVVKLIEQKADPNFVDDEGGTALYLSSQEGYDDIVDVLIAAGANVNYFRPGVGTTPVFMASQNGHHEVIRKLARSGADVNLTMNGELNSLTPSPTIIAATHGHQKCVDALIEAGSNVNYASPGNGLTALHISSALGYQEVVRSLIRARADPNQTMTDSKANSALILAASKGNLQCVDILIESGAHINYTCAEDSSTALVSATQVGSMAVVRSLLTAGADPRIAMNNGNTPLDIARASKNTQIVALLEAKIAELDRSA